MPRPNSTVRAPSRAGSGPGCLSPLTVSCARFGMVSLVGSYNVFLRTILALGALLLCASAAYAAESETSKGSENDYIFPELPKEMLVREGKRFFFRPILAVFADYTWFEQDDASLVQVGEQEDSPELRAARFGAILRSKSKARWDLFVTLDFQERRTRDEQVFRLFDLRFGIPLGPVKLDVGKQKEPFVLEMSGLSALLPQQERILSPFFVTRSIGVRLSGSLAEKRMTWAAGWFNDWLESGRSFGDNANDYVARLTGLVSVSPDDLDFVHLGLGMRRVGDDAGMLRFYGRPESNVADYYVDTGDFPARYATQLSLEAVWDRGPVMITAEHVEAWVEAPDSGNPRFTGDYAAVSWVVTGESRRYNRASGYTEGIVPTNRAGAVEVMVRYSRLDLTDAAIEGGVLGKWHWGVNWWASPQWKLGASYGDADLDRNALSGGTKMAMLRVQWLY
jgi:phosphate-selective porin OprO/OprP